MRHDRSIGDAVLRDVGSSGRMASTAIGRVVNPASRIDGMIRVHGTCMLVSETTRAASGSNFVTRPAELMLATGTTRPIELHELVGVSVVDILADAKLRPDPAPASRLPAWRQMFGACRAGCFGEAAAASADAGGPAAGRLAAPGARHLAGLYADAPAGCSPVLRFTAT